MSICKIGEKKEIDGKWYQKARRSSLADECDGCSFHTGRCPLPAYPGKIGLSIENGGSECEGTIWVACPAPKPAKKPAPAKWTPIPADTKLTKAKIIEMANKLGAENAKLKSKLAKGVG